MSIFINVTDPVGLYYISLSVSVWVGIWIKIRSQFR